MWRMKQLLLVCAVVMGQSVLAAVKKPLTKEESAKVIENEIRYRTNKPTGELTKADLEKVKLLRLDRNRLTDVKELEKLTELHLVGNQLTEIPKGLEKLTQLISLQIAANPALTYAQIAELQKALPKCKIFSNLKK